MARQANERIVSESLVDAKMANASPLQGERGSAKKCNSVRGGRSTLDDMRIQRESTDDRESVK